MSDRDVPWRVQRVEPCAAVPETLQRLYTGDLGYPKDSLVTPPGGSAIANAHN